MNHHKACSQERAFSVSTRSPNVETGGGKRGACVGTGNRAPVTWVQHQRLAFLRAVVAASFGIESPHFGNLAMRVCFAFVLAAFALLAFGQEKDLVSAPTPNVPQRLQQRHAFTFQENTTAPSFRHSWYWEVPDFSPDLAERNRWLPRGAQISNSDFTPASLRWNFEGKRKIVPVIDLTVMQIKPGERSTTAVPSADNSTSQFAPGALWTKATHSISELLHY